MPVTAIDFTFVDKQPGKAEGRKTYPAGTPVTVCPPGSDHEAADLIDCLRRTRLFTGQDHCIVMIDGFRTVLPLRHIVHSVGK